jgi:hypothetical protein
MRRKSVIYLQIQTGKLLPHGMVDQQTVDWQPLPEENSQLLSTRKYSISSGYTTICISNCPIDKDYLVTGVQLFQQTVKVKGLIWGWNPESPLSLRIFRKKFEFESGLINEQNTTDFIRENQEMEWLKAKNYGIHIHVDKILVLYLEKSAPFFASAYIEINEVSIDMKIFEDITDVGEEVEVSLKTPLTSVGFMHYFFPRDDYHIVFFNVKFKGRLRPFVKSLNYLDYL